MKNKLTKLALFAAFSCASANAVTLTTTLIANTSTNVGLVTTTESGSLSNVTGLAWIYASSVQLSASGMTGITTRSGFEALLTLDPGVVRSSVAVTNGALTSSASTELGAAANKSYVWFQNTSGSSYGAFQGPNVPALGALTLNSQTMTEDLIGTSTYSAVGTSGFQLVPEPSAALLGALGALGLLRRRRN